MFGLNLYKVPGAFVFAFTGHFGVGKTLLMTEQAIKMAEKYHLRIVANYEINYQAARRYCYHKGYKWFQSFGVITYQPDLYKLLHYNNSIILLDEAGVELFSRSFGGKEGQKRIELFDRLFRIRHFGSYLFYACQKHSQVDKQFRDMTHCWVWCRGFQKFDLFMRRSRLYARSAYAFSDIAYEEFLEERLAGKMLRTLLLSEFRYFYSLFSLLRFYYEVLGLFKFLFHIRAFLAACKYRAVHASKNSPSPAVAWFLHFFEKDFLQYWNKWRAWEFRPCDEFLLFPMFDSFAHRSRPSKSTLKKENCTCLRLF